MQWLPTFSRRSRRSLRHRAMEIISKERSDAMKENGVRHLLPDPVCAIFHSLNRHLTERYFLLREAPNAEFLAGNRFPVKEANDLMVYLRERTGSTRRS